MSQLVALFDIDDTLCDTTGQTNLDLRKVFNDGREIITDYTSERCQAYMRREIRRIRSQPGWWTNLPRLNDGFQLYNLMQSEGVEIEILTKMPETYPLALWEKLQWRKKNTPRANNINLTLNKKDTSQTF